MKKLDKNVTYHYDELETYVGKGADKGFNVTLYLSQDQHSTGYTVAVNNCGKVTFHHYDNERAARSMYNTIMGK